MEFNCKIGDWWYILKLKEAGKLYMRIVVQRVDSARVTTDDRHNESVARGLMLLVAVEQGDTIQEIEWCAGKCASMRIFPDDNGKMNLSVKDILGEVLSISQFTLAARIQKGNRPSFTNAADREIAIELYEKFKEALRKKGLVVKDGVFGAHMKVELTNDGPVTFIVEKNSSQTEES